MENDNIKNTTYTYTSGGGYISPWNINNLQKVTYTFDSNIANWDYVYVRITPYIGLGYFDGQVDGTYTMPNGTFNLANGNYPNLYANSNEYGNYVEANPIVLASARLIWPSLWYTHELFIQSHEDHCPLTNIPIHYNANRHAIGFDIQNNATVQPAAIVGNTLTPPPNAGTVHEEVLLREYGKVMYYKVEYSRDMHNFADDVFYVSSSDFDRSANPNEWTAVNLKDAPFNHDLYYHSGTATNAATMEIVANSKLSPYPNFKDLNVWFDTNYGLRKVLAITFTTIPNVDTGGITMQFH